MLYQMMAIAWKDIKVLLRDRGGITTLFLMPIMFILIMTAAQTGMYRQRPQEAVPVLVVNQDTGDLAARTIEDLKGLEGLRIEDRWDGQALTRATAEDLIRGGTRRVAVLFPADFSARVLARATGPAAPQTTVTYIADPAAGVQFLAPIQGTVQGYILRTAGYAQAPEQIGAAFREMAAAAGPQMAPVLAQAGAQFVAKLKSDGPGASAAGSAVAFEQVAPAGFQVTQFPDSAQQNVPGYTLFGVFWIVQFLAQSILDEKQAGTFRRLMAAPLSRAAMLLGKLAPAYLVNLIQVALMFGVGVLVFNLSLGSDLLALALVTLATAAAATGLGLLVAALGKTSQQIGGLSSLLVLTLAALGGSMVPTFAMPAFMQAISHVSPHAWALDGYQDVMVRGLGVSAVLPEVGVLALYAAAFFGIAVWRFRFD